MTYKISVVIPSRWNIDNIINIFWCLKDQNFQDFNVYLIIDSKLDEQWFEFLKSSIINKLQLNNQDFSKWVWLWDKKYNLISNLNSDFDSQIGEWASYVRNYWLNLAAWEFINFFDDDIIFDNDYIQKSLDYRNSFKTQLWKDFVLTPSLMYRKTWKIQNQWFKRYIFRQSRPQINFLKDKKPVWSADRFGFIQLYSWNSIFAPSSLLKQFQFDVDINFVAEDLDFTYSIHRAWYPIIVLADLKVYHMERDKTILQQARVWDSLSAYQKWKNRIIFVRKHWNFLQKLIFFTFWLRANNLRLILKINKHSQWKEKRKLISSFLKWNWDWLFRY